MRTEIEEKYDLDTVVKHLEDDGMVEEAVKDIIADSKEDGGLIVEAISVPYLEKKTFKHVFETHYPKGEERAMGTVPVKVILCTPIPPLQEECIAKRGFHDCFIPCSRLKLPDVNVDFYLNDIFVTPMHCIYLYPHSVQGIDPSSEIPVHDHYGFSVLDPDLCKIIYDLMEGVFLKLKNTKDVVELPSVEELANREFFRRNLPKLKEIKTGVISAGTFYETEEQAWVFFEEHKSPYYRSEIDLDLVPLDSF